MKQRDVCSVSFSGGEKNGGLSGSSKQLEIKKQSLLESWESEGRVRERE